MTYSLTFNKKSKLTFKKTNALFAKNHMRWSPKTHNFIFKSFILLFRLFYKSSLQDNKQRITNHSSHSFLFPHYYIKLTCYVSIISFLLLTLSSLHHSSFYKENIFFNTCTSSHLNLSNQFPTCGNNIFISSNHFHIPTTVSVFLYFLDYFVFPPLHHRIIAIIHSLNF